MKHLHFGFINDFFWCVFSHFFFYEYLINSDYIVLPDTDWHQIGFHVIRCKQTSQNEWKFMNLSQKNEIIHPVWITNIKVETFRVTPGDEILSKIIFRYSVTLRCYYKFDLSVIFVFAFRHFTIVEAGNSRCHAWLLLFMHYFRLKQLMQLIPISWSDTSRVYKKQSLWCFLS